MTAATDAVVGLVAPVDAGKTTLAEALLFRAGAIRRQGRVDHGDAHLDTHALERERGITIFAKQTALDHAGAHLMIVDTPGHVDFSAEMERVLPVLDYAVLVVSATDGVQGHTETLWELLARYRVPTILFINKMDLADGDAAAVRGVLARRLGAPLVAGEGLAAVCRAADRAPAAALEDAAAGAPAAALEDAAATDERALDEYLETGTLAPATVRRLVAERAVFPCFAGAALKGEGVPALLDGIAALVRQQMWPAAFGARVYRVSRGPRGERLAWLKVTGGELRAKMPLAGVTRGEAWEEKADQVRLYDADSYEIAQAVPAGRVCAVSGLTRVMPGDGIGAEAAAAPPALVPVLSYRVDPGEADITHLVRALRELADEEPLLGVRWEEQLGEVHVQLMGAVQQEVLAEELHRRFGLSVTFGTGGILYRETLTAPACGVGHFEPLRHYAEVRLLIEPGPRGSGVVAGSRASEDDLDRNWQRLILTHVLERDHPGVLTGAPLTDVRVTVLGGRAHLKHTEGGDFRQATYRAVRQGLMEARTAGACELMEPWYRFRLAVPSDKVGRALADVQRMAAVFDPPEVAGDRARLTGIAPVCEMRSYALEVAAYTGGRGHLSLEFACYRPCHNAEEVIAAGAYDPAADLANTPDSVFCAHGAGYTVPWDEVPAHAHTVIEPARLRPWRSAEEVFGS
ncbi:TetM/TetW/TetO/TetS family tetracycline resistance ribosomal protection protein [Collinsella sp. An268]|uniref:elongation factor G n=1 Tax=Collinsella sp. An268 TaxID=1965612 RepID=UPI000B398800|nr:TetM/TetW/TetO/TetS family tetracycline resistance ribosomal protection protein [Collinsella sp. An268]OUO64915.1 GTP-binding protein [Collinsella sp. An268]